MGILSCWRIVFLNKVFSIDELEFKSEITGDDLTIVTDISKRVFSDTENSKVYSILNAFDNNPNDLTYIIESNGDIGWEFDEDVLLKYVTIDMRNTYANNTSQFPDTVNLRLQYSGSRSGPWISFSEIAIPKASIDNEIYTWDVLSTQIKQSIVGEGSVLVNGTAQTFSFAGSSDYTLYKISGRCNLTLNSYTVVPVFNTFFFDGEDNTIITSSTITHIVKNTQVGTPSSTYLINSSSIAPDEYNRLLLK